MKPFNKPYSPIKSRLVFFTDDKAFLEQRNGKFVQIGGEKEFNQYRVQKIKETHKRYKETGDRTEFLKPIWEINYVAEALDLTLKGIGYKEEGELIVVPENSIVEKRQAVMSCY